MYKQSEVALRRCSTDNNAQFLPTSCVPVKPVSKFIQPLVIGKSDEATYNTCNSRPSKTSYSKARKQLPRRRNLSEDRAKRNVKSNKSQEKQKRSNKDKRYNMFVDKAVLNKSKNKQDASSKDGVTSVSTTTNVSKPVKATKGRCDLIMVTKFLQNQ